MQEQHCLRIEKWSTEIMPLFAGSSPLSMESIAEMQRLSAREVVIVGAAGLDAALAEMLAARLIGDEKEISAFIGLGGESMAPAGTFSARIQLASMVGILRSKEVAALTTLRKLRNQMAHRVNVDITADAQFALVEKLYSWIDGIMKRSGRHPNGAGVFGAFERTEQDAKTAVVAAIASLHELFSNVSKIVRKLALVTVPREGD